MRDLLVYARALPDIGDEPVRYYHDDSGLECDAIIELTDGRWAGIEIKSSQSKVDDAAKNLLRLREKLLKNPQSRVLRNFWRCLLAWEISPTNAKMAST